MLWLFSKKSQSIRRFVFIFMFIGSIIGCAGGQQVAKDDAAAREEVAAPLDNSYRNLVVYELEAKPELTRDYSEAIKECQSSMVTSLLMKNKYDRVEPAGSAESNKENSTLLVKIKLNDMRIASFAARFWGGAFAGNSYMNMHMKLVDAATRDVVREEDFNSSNNAWGAAFNFGASDRSLPSDMGKIMAEYVAQVVPAQ